MLPAKQIALWADKLRDISALGLKFSGNIYNRERFQKIQEIAIEMIALSTNTSIGQLEPLRTTILTRPSPLVGGDAAIIDSEGRILLIQRADNKMWAMPGGLSEVGETPVEGVLREVVEETGYNCQAISLIGIFDSRLCGTTYPLQLYHFTFLCVPLEDEKQRVPLHQQETLDVNWFHEDSLPENIDPGHISRISEAFRVWRGDERAFFDK
ncbi:MAG: NUDIX hydrolase N-terminal domain-containing protein [Candidatus Heimdallarchaeota archaeon]|nr:MAG: NUDIX hydrolase N-terminal domain-containing protein [Candidatus Heimdallarchaeota archaeon]